jgi:hypothetical protein
VSLETASLETVSRDRGRSFACLSRLGRGGRDSAECVINSSLVLSGGLQMNVYAGRLSDHLRIMAWIASGVGGVRPGQVPPVACAAPSFAESFLRSSASL